MPRAAWIVLLSAAAAVSLGLGIRQTYGLFLLPMGVEHGITATALGAAIAIHNLVWGLTQPIAGAMGDKYGTGRIVLAGAAIYMAGLILSALWVHPVSLMLGIGILTGIGVACVGPGIVLGAVGRAVTPERRGDALGLASAGGSIGQAAMVPIVQWGIADLGTSGAFLLLAALLSLTVFIAPRLEWNPPSATAQSAAGLDGLVRVARAALRQRDYALLTFGFFACGFQLAFITTHLPAHLSLCGMPASLGATALLLVGLFNIPGSWLCGRAGNWVRPEIALGVIYAARTVLVAVFALLPVTEWGTIIFAAAMGFIWLGTIPLTSAAIARRFGVADLGALYGVCFFSHQVGGFLGAGAGAVVFDMSGSYMAFWPVMVLVGITAVLANLMTRPPERVATA
jgi:predicted MFS family arabinose efflux permease